MPNNSDLFIRLDKIPADRIKKANSKNEDGILISLTLAPLRKKDKFGNSHTIYVKRSREDKEAKTPPIYCGSGKEFIPYAEREQEEKPSYKQTEEDDYPY